MNYVIYSLSYVTVFILKDWIFASALLVVINNLYAVGLGSFFKNTIIITVNLKSSNHAST